MTKRTVDKLQRQANDYCLHIRDLHHKMNSGVIRERRLVLAKNLPHPTYVLSCWVVYMRDNNIYSELETSLIGDRDFLLNLAFNGCEDSGARIFLADPKNNELREY